MLKSGFFRLLPAVFLSLTFWLHAAAPSEPLPPHLAAHVSVKSPLGLLESADGYISRATVGSANEFPPGFVAMLAQFSLPIPLDSWGADEDAHILFLPSGGKDLDMVIVFHAEDLEELTSSLTMRNWDVDDAVEEEGYERVVYMETPEGKEFVLVDLNDGLMAVAEAVEHVKTALGDAGWRPKHHSDADVFVNFTFDRGEKSAKDRAADAMQKGVKGMADRLAAEGVSRETADGLAAAVERYLPLMAAEVDYLENIMCEMRLDEKSMLLDFGGKFVAGGILGEITENLAKAGAVQNKFADNVPTNVTSFSVIPPASTFLANAPERIVKFNADLYGMIFPGLGQRIAEASKAFFDSGVNGSVTVNFARDYRQFSVTLLETADPGMAMQSFLDTFVLMNEAWAKAITNEDYGMQLVNERVNEEGLSYMRTSPVFANPEKFREMLERVNGGNREVRLDFDMLTRLRFYFATLDGMLMMGIGDASDAEFHEAFSILKDKAAEPMLGRKSIKAMQGDLKPDQGCLGYLDADGAFWLFATQAAEGLESMLGAEDSAVARAALEKTKDKLQNKGAVIGVAGGAEDGWLLCRLAIPATAANTVLLDYETFERFRVQEAARQVPDADEDEDDEDDDGEWDDSGEGEEEVEITEEDETA